MTLGTSDPVQYTCKCSANTSNDGSVLLFYRYFAANPPLESALLPQTKQDLENLATWYRSQCTTFQLGGKIRVAQEGFNVTVGGTSHNINMFVESCVHHWSFARLNLESEKERRRYFKPTPGCSCVFGGEVRIRVTAEATPMGVQDYAPKSWDKVLSLSPEEFHEKLSADDMDLRLLDVRNHYESRIGYFVTGRGMKALAPPIRRFSQWPQYVKARLPEITGETDETVDRANRLDKKSFLTYCTGGIRCEKGVRFMQEQVRPDDVVYTLNGGIAAYLEWMEAEIKSGKKTANESLFKGRNYVFDGRGTTGLDGETQLVSKCHVCQTPSADLDKCQSARCHLVLVVCMECQRIEDARCCLECSEIDNESAHGTGGSQTTRKMCACEREREAQLWGKSPRRS